MKKIILMIMFALVIPHSVLAIDLTVVSTGEMKTPDAENKIVEGWALTETGLERVKAVLMKKYDLVEKDDLISSTRVTRLKDNEALEGEFIILNDIDPEKVSLAKITAGDFESGVLIQLGQREYVLQRKFSPDKVTLTMVLYLTGKDEQKKQIIYTCKTGGVDYPFCGDEGFENLIWAGDLDGDGHLDLILNLSKKYSHYPYQLYLSKDADKGMLLKLKSTFDRYSC